MILIWRICVSLFAGLAVMFLSVLAVSVFNGNLFKIDIISANIAVFCTAVIATVWDATK